MTRYLRQLIAGETLSREDARLIMLGIAGGKYNDAQVAALLMAVQTRGATVDELLGLRDGLLETGKSVDLGRDDTLDIVGTGGDGKNTFNISTCAAFVIAGAGYKVAKHGNGASTSVSGASNVLQGLGAKFTDEESTLRRSLDEAGVCYLHAPLFAHGMRAVAAVRRQLGVPTCFNLLGPLVNPSRPRHSLHGTATQGQLRLYTLAHQRLGDSFGVVTSYDGYDEISLTSGFKLVTNNYEKVFTPLDMGLRYVRPEEIQGGATPAEARSVFESVLRGTSTEAARNVVLANAACGISIVDPCLPMAETVDKARVSLESGAALKCLSKFLEINS